ncbi:MAG: isoprenylcysteine carboxylmethyltransferase family protein [Gammaproteobacteria bacterium]|nr:isoprenylcysteine carboxylmethyltransferase family protein [Gammaproteobacteria bacterium]MBU2157982.1 isoprenylcysteine carboxylmethyltransferase family protein [Gammaproteobacteria bacterium]MBU2255271.1 isoprenylcysteine carboxylmethyltransferase family protein [Gammaproteobacteria bacterium]MBU2293494.1 isoprenylcysteine carboxylmethyltransferase family protein [Gammaproteobacteria bacterium]
MVWLQGLAFALGTLLLLALSWRVLLRPQSHGFYRFFAWEAILALLVLNGPVWFVDRFALHQRLSWALLFASLLLLFTGLYQLRRMGRPDGQRTDAELFAFERTSQLVTSGIFRVIRHPLYASLLLLAWGVACKQPNGLSLALALLASLILWLTAKRDEAECLQQFGEAYRDYMQRSKMFIPWLF